MTAKKFFSLIHGDQIHIAPKVRVIPANEFSKLLQAHEVLKAVQDDAKLYRVEVTADCEKLKEAAQKEGYEAGFVAWVDKVTELEAEIKQVRLDVERVIVPIALKAARKIVGEQLDLSEKTIVSIVSNNLKAVSQHKRITIWVSRQDRAVLEQHRDELRSLFEKLEVLTIQEREDIAPGGCVIETEGGIINAQLDNQWLILENAFTRLAAQTLMKEAVQTPEPTPKPEAVVEKTEEPEPAEQES